MRTDGMYEQLELYADADNAGERIDRFVAEQLPDVSRSMAQRLLIEGLVTVGGAVVSKNSRLHGGEDVLIRLPPPKETAVLPENLPLDVVYEDGDLLVVNKPKGMVVHPAAGNESGTLVNALLYHCRDSLSGIGGEVRPGIVHRIDKNTSGLLVVAKNDRAHNALAAQLKAHSMERQYEAVVYGRLRDDEGVVDAPIGRSPTDRKRMAVTERHSRRAVTHYTVLRRFAAFTHVGLRLETGRTHQIRVHMAYIGHPLAGDEVYGPKKVIESLQGQCLHARTLGFVHPTTGEWMQFTSALPPLFCALLAELERAERT